MTLRNTFCLRVPQKWMRDSWVQGGVVFGLTKEYRTQTIPKQTHRVMPPEVSSRDEDVDLKEIGLSQQVWDQLHSVGI